MMIELLPYCQRQLESNMASIRNARSCSHVYHREVHASCWGASLIRLAASSALRLGTSFPNSTNLSFG